MSSSTIRPSRQASVWSDAVGACEATPVPARSLTLGQFNVARVARVGDAQTAGAVDHRDRSVVERQAADLADAGADRRALRPDAQADAARDRRRHGTAPEFKKPAA